jgi:hypothetical protein
MKLQEASPRCAAVSTRVEKYTHPRDKRGPRPRGVLQGRAVEGRLHKNCAMAGGAGGFASASERNFAAKTAGKCKFLQSGAGQLCLGTHFALDAVT